MDKTSGFAFYHAYQFIFGVTTRRLQSHDLLNRNSHHRRATTARLLPDQQLRDNEPQPCRESLHIGTVLVTRQMKYFPKVTFGWELKVQVGDMLIPVSLWNKTTRTMKMDVPTKIEAIKHEKVCESGIMFYVQAGLKKVWLDSHWFLPPSPSKL